MERKERNVKKTATRVLIGGLLIGIMGLATTSYSSPPGIPQPFNISLEPIGHMTKGAPITMSLTFGPLSEYYVCGDTGTLVVMTLSYPGRDTLSRSDLPVIFDENHSYTTTFDINVPDNAVTKLRLLLGCGWIEAYPIERTLVTTGDTVQFLIGYQPPPSTPAFVNNDPIRDTLTVAQLQTKYEVVLDLHDPEKAKAAENILGIIPDSCLIDRERGHYKIKTTLENLIKIGDQGITGRFVKPPPWDIENKKPSDSILEKKQAPNLNDSQGALPPPHIPCFRA